MGGEDAWANVDKTQVGGCLPRAAWRGTGRSKENIGGTYPDLELFAF